MKMNNKKNFRIAMVLSLLILTEISLVLFLFKILLVPNEINGVKMYPEKVSARSLVSSENFSLMWNKETEDGNQHIVYMQMFSLNDDQLIYSSENSLTALNYATGDVRWSIKTPESSTFHLYKDKLYSVTAYDAVISFAPEENINMPSDCNSKDLSTIRVYDPNNGQKIWEYSYRMAASYNGISFKNNSAFVQGLTFTFTDKYISELEVDLATGKVLSVHCRNSNDFGHSNVGETEGVLSSGFWPIFDDLGWRLNVDEPAFVVEGNKLIMLNREDKRPMRFVEFSGSELNPYDVQMIARNNLLVVYLDDSNQFFVFQMK